MLKITVFAWCFHDLAPFEGYHYSVTVPTAQAQLLSVPLQDLRRRTSMKWKRYPEDVLPMWVAELDVPLASPIVEAVRDAITRGDTGYPEGNEYAEAVAVFAAKRWGWKFDAVATAIVPDVLLGIVEVLKLTTRPGDSVIVNSPVYQCFYPLIRGADRRIVHAELGADGRLEFDVLEASFSAASGAGKTSSLPAL